MRTHRRTLGQTMTEYMLVISVIVIALAAVVYTPMMNAAETGSNGFKENMMGGAKQGYAGSASGGRR